MKNYVYLLTVACCLGFFYIFSCNKSNDAKPSASVTEPMLFLDPNTAQNMAFRYKGDKRKGLLYNEAGENIGFDTKSMWLSLDSLKKYIAKMEAACAKNGYNGLSKGIRIYLAKYPEKLDTYNDLKTVNPEYAGRQTIFMVPTYNNGIGNIDFNPSSPERLNGKYPLPYYEYFKKQSKESTSTRTKKSTKMGYYYFQQESYIYNHSGIEPPPRRSDGDGLTYSEE